MTPAAGSDVTTRTITMAFVDTDEDHCPVQAEFRYDPVDPYAVRIRFLSGIAGQDSWLFGRDLLVEGCHEPVGTGDVVVWPCLSSEGCAVVILELVCAEGELVLQAATRDVQDFLNRTIASVPLGAESAVLDIEAELVQLLSR